MWGARREGEKGEGERRKRARPPPPSIHAHHNTITALRTSAYCTGPYTDMSSDSRLAVIDRGSPSMCSARSRRPDLLSAGAGGWGVCAHVCRALIWQTGASPKCAARQPRRLPVRCIMVTRPFALPSTQAGAPQH